ncbi:helix-turn-helix transcriptional regulator [Herbidospora galbida]|uniref:Helix-turn-helix transcriptional regulator n=1 Tax=Herbidospora galbida TaxID=2575442 RepID=A0A4U3M6N1_9ACTN|nr:helix-turn-helix transcriptional regulator [Herbidospora galbida]TKK84585.1 helix-turn-helix transcriptional regulator [Herbidospora galbida]
MFMEYQTHLEGAPSLADRLQLCFEIFLDPDSHEDPSKRVAYNEQYVAKASGVSRSNIRRILSGEMDNPTIGTIAKLATFWGVPAAYFLSDATGQAMYYELRALSDAAREGAASIALLVLTAPMSVEQMTPEMLTRGHAGQHSAGDQVLHVLSVDRELVPVPGETM